MTIGELIELLTGIFEIIAEYFSKLFGGDDESETTAPAA